MLNAHVFFAVVAGCAHRFRCHVDTVFKNAQLRKSQERSNQKGRTTAELLSVLFLNMAKGYLGNPSVRPRDTLFSNLAPSVAGSSGRLVVSSVIWKRFAEILPSTPRGVVDLPSQVV
jgi:hypothetical protein